MIVQSTALRLADRLENDGFHSETEVLVAAELKRLHAENVLLKSRQTTDEGLYTLALEERDAARHVYQILKDERNVLLDALVSFTKSEYIKKKHPKRYAKAVAAIKAVEE